MNHPSYPDLSFDLRIRPAEKSTGEWQYSLGSPPIPERKFVEAVFYKGVNITDFVHTHCDHLFERWEEEINQ